MTQQDMTLYSVILPLVGYGMTIMHAWIVNGKRLKSWHLIALWASVGDLFIATSLVHWAIHINLATITPVSLAISIILISKLMKKDGDDSVINMECADRPPQLS